MAKNMQEGKTVSKPSRVFITLFSFLCLVQVFSQRALAQTRLFLETGPVWQHRNDIRIPNQGGTRLDFDNFDQGPFLSYRFELIWPFNEKHHLRGVIAPLNLAVKGQPEKDVFFNNQIFNADQELEIDYSFNSYRMTYFYSFWGSGLTQLNIGLTTKIRDAEIKLKQGSQLASYDNTGFVPLIYFEYQRPFSQSWLLNINADAATASQGRAIDLAVKLRRKIYEDLSLGLGLRTLEGGADNDEVYTFSWLNYVLIDVQKTF
jgi:hypothetical protein